VFCFGLWLGPGKRPNAIPTGRNSIIRQLPAHTSIILSRNPWGITARHISCSAGIVGINLSEICQMRSSTQRPATLSMQRVSHRWMQHFQLSSKHTHMLQTSIKYTPASAWALAPHPPPWSRPLEQKHKQQCTPLIYRRAVLFDEFPDAC
jgi:hypothetical protein